ncbi:MAG: hydroxylase, partial [Planctomycetota bacterium]
CKLYAETHAVKLGDPIPEFGNARAADLPNGARVGVRAPMRATETPVIRPYWLVKDIAAAVAAAKKAGATIAIGPMKMPGGQGQFAIYLQGGIEHGLWQKK